MRKWTWSWGVMLIACLTACVSAQQESNLDYSGLVDVGDYRLYLECTGSGSPLVVMEAGWGDASATWELVTPEVGEHTRVCVYDRVGLGNSDPGPEPATYLEAVQDLHQLLVTAGERGPYILVGHSLGGMYTRLFQSQYPEEVVGLVLVDSSHPDTFERNLAVLPPETEGENETLSFYRDWFSTMSKDPTLPQSLLGPGSLGDLPLVVLTGMDKERDWLPADLNERLNQIWLDLQTELALMSTNSSHIVSEQSGHFIQQDQPQLVIEAILSILEQVQP